MMTLSYVQQKPLLLLILPIIFQCRNAAARRIVAFQYVEDSAVCNPGSNFNVKLRDFHVDCGNANHGCTPGNSIMIYGEFEAYDTFFSVADVDIKACTPRLGEIVCTNNFIMTDMNVCADLALWDEDGYQKCNEQGYYSFEASFDLPGKTWWEDLAFEGLSFQIYVTLDQDLKCHGQFITHVYYGNEKWMLLVSASSMAIVFGAYYFVQKKRQASTGKINLAVEEAQATDDAESRPPPKSENAANRKSKIPVPQSQDSTGDDESVTTTSYLRMLDFSPEGLSHRDQMEQVRQTHFERLRKTREWRMASSSKDGLPS